MDDCIHFRNSTKSKRYIENKLRRVLQGCSRPMHLEVEFRNNTWIKKRKELGLSSYHKSVTKLLKGGLFYKIILKNNGILKKSMKEFCIHDLSTFCLLGRGGEPVRAC